MVFHKLDSKRITTLIVSIIIIAMGLIINYGDATTNNAVANSTITEMTHIGAQTEILLESLLFESEVTLLRLADYIVDNEIEIDDIPEYLNSQTYDKSFENIYYITQNGIGVSHTNSTRDFKDNNTYIKALSKETYISPPYEVQDTDKIILEIATPIIQNDIVVGVLFGEFSMDNFTQILKENTQNMGEMFILDYSFNLFYSTSSRHIDSGYISDDDFEAMGTDNVANAIRELKIGQNGGFTYTYLGEEKAMVYFPIDLTQWALAMNVEVAALSTELTQAVSQFEFIAAVVYWAVIVLVLYLALVQYRTNRAITNAAYYDSLTKLPNLLKLKKDIKDALLLKKHRKYSIVIFDIENFKAINEMFGYTVGDNTLRAIKTFSDSFNEPSLITARLSDDKFAMFAKSSFLFDLSVLICRVEHHYNEFVPELIDYAATFKIGRYEIADNETDVDGIISKVMLAHASAKSSKGEIICDYDDNFRQKLLVEAEITNKMRSALDNEEFQIYLQPKFSTSDDKLVGAEALVRWIQADGKMIFPSDFIPLFERNGFIVELDKYVLENVCITLNSWHKKGFGAIPISVNCSRLNLENPLYVENIAAIADKYEIPHNLIEIELTESVTIEIEYKIQELLAEMRFNNFKTSIDDFGAGYSSLGMLKNINVDTLKMDRSFFVDGKNARRDDMLIDSIVKMSHNLGMYVVAEGIETQEQVRLLKTMNCDAIQGYVHAKPMPVSEFEKNYSNSIREFSLERQTQLPTIQNINDAKFANSFAPCGILVTKIDENFTIVEANDYYFDMIGYTRTEVRDVFNNQCIQNMNTESAINFKKYFNEKMKTDPYSHIEFTNKFTPKHGEEHTYLLKGKVANNEKDEKQLYFSMMDITDLSNIDTALQIEKDFVARIATLTNNAFFDYEITDNKMRFSKNFAERFNIPEIIEDFTNSSVMKTVFSKYNSSLFPIDIPAGKFDGEFCIALPSGEPTWYLYNYTVLNDEKSKKQRVVGKMSEAIGHKLEWDILRVKSEANPQNTAYNKKATDRYIRNYLRLANPDNDTGAFFVVGIGNFSKIKEMLGQDFSHECLKDIGMILRSTVRSSDIIEKIAEDKFFVFIGNNKNLEFAKKKANELCTLLSKTYTKGEITIDTIANIGISLYPEHGDDFAAVYEKANKALAQAKKTKAKGYCVYTEELT